MIVDLLKISVILRLLEIALVPTVETLRCPQYFFLLFSPTFELKLDI